ncbi:MAG TPA: hypothetical protein VIH03_03955 [Nitrososphaerales archaeon]
MAEKKKKVKVGKKKIQSAETAQARTNRPRHSETTRVALLVLPPEPTEKEIKAREKCIEHTHRVAGPKLTDKRPTRGAGRKSVLKEPKVPETIPTPSTET